MKQKPQWVILFTIAFLFLCPAFAGKVLARPADSVFVKGVSDYGYNDMTVEQKKIYRSIGEKMDEFFYSGKDYNSEIPPGLSQDDGSVVIIGYQEYDITDISDLDVVAAYIAYDLDHPAYYWVDSTCIDWMEDDTDPNKYYLVLYADVSFAKAAERERLNNLIERGVREYADLANRYGATTLDKIAIVCEKILSTVDYPETKDMVELMKRKIHCVQALFDDPKDAVCEAYADTFAMIMNYMEIPNIYLYGRIDGIDNMTHVWNAVSDDGGKTYMNVDLTWDDFGVDGFSYNYFGIPESDFGKTHILFNHSTQSVDSGLAWLYDVDTSNFTDSFELTYFFRSGLYYDGSGDANEFAARVRQKAKQDQECGITSFYNIVFLVKDPNDAYKVLDSLGGCAPHAEYEMYNGEYYIFVIDRRSSSFDDPLMTFEMSGSEFIYNGSVQKPAITVKDGWKVLVEGTDYTISFSKPKPSKVGNYTLTVTGLGNYKGTKEFSFTIKKANTLKTTAKQVKISEKSLRNAKNTYTAGKPLNLKKSGQGAKTYELISGNEGISVDRSTGKLKVNKDLPAGEYPLIIKVTAAGNKTYYPSEQTVETSLVVKEYVKKANTLNVKPKEIKVSAKRLDKAKSHIITSKPVSLKKSGQGNKTYEKISGDERISVDPKTGKLTLDKGLTGGEYPLTIKVTAAGNSNYLPGEQVVETKLVIN